MYILKDEKEIHGVFSTESYAILASRFVQASAYSSAISDLRIVPVTLDTIRGNDIRTIMNFYESAVHEKKALGPF